MPKMFTKAAFARLEAQMTKKEHQGESSDEDSLPEVNEEIICSICLEEVLTEYLRLPCRHCFHRSCIIEWKTKKPQCPNCRLEEQYHCFFVSRFSLAGNIAERQVPTRVSIREMNNCTV